MAPKVKPAKEFNIVFVTNKKHMYGMYKRMLISPKSLAKWIGKDNAALVIDLALSSKGDKFEKKFRKHGRVIFYTK